MLKVLTLIFFCFYPWWFLSIWIHPWYGPILGVAFTLFSLIFLRQFPDLILLSLLNAKERRKANASIAQDTLTKVAFHYRIPKPRLYFTFKGTRNVYALFQRKKYTLVLHESCLGLLTTEELEAVFHWLLAPQMKRMARRGTFYNSLATLTILPFILCRWFISKLTFLPEKISDGPRTAFEICSAVIIELTHSIFYDRNLVLKNDQDIKSRPGMGLHLISAIGKMEQAKEAFSWSEKILMSNRFSQTEYQVRIFSLLTDYADPEARIEILKSMEARS